MVKFKKTLSNWLNARHILIIQNEEDFAEKATYKFTYAKIVFFSFLSFLLVFALSFYLVQTVLDQWFDPRYAQRQNRQDLVTLSLSLDSLSQELESRDNYIASIKNILGGETGEEETKETVATQPSQVNGIGEMEKVDSAFQAAFERGSGDLLISGNIDDVDLRQMYFFPPITGYISAPFDPKNNHYGVDIVTKKDEPVKAMADGTVIFTGWTQTDGNVIAIQHRENIISIYKHNATLTRKTGDIVTAGDILAIVGNTGELTSGPHLHVELWYNGSSVNPEEFISF